MIRCGASMTTVPLDGRCTISELKVGPLEWRSLMEQRSPLETVMRPSTVCSLHVRIYRTEQRADHPTANASDSRQARPKAFVMLISPCRSPRISRNFPLNQCGGRYVSDRATFKDVTHPPPFLGPH